MKKRVMVLIFLLIVVCAFSQTPDWQWATQAGGSGGDDTGYSITLDDAGNSYVTGSFKSIAAFGAYSLTSIGNSDIFVAKMDASGNWLWATQAGGSSADEGYEITLDNDGNSYVTGYFEETVTFGTYSLTSSGNSDIFVAKMDTDGNWLWATQAGGNSDDEGYEITLDNDGNSYVTGYFEGTATFGALSLTSSGYSDIFVAKIDTDGNWLWASQAGSTYDDDQGRGIAIDDAGNNYVTGYFCGVATFGSYSITSTGESNIFMAKMDADGNWLWVNGAGGNTDNYGRSIIVDNAGNSYTIGDFEGTATFGPYTLYGNQYSDIFISKIDADGNWLWATQAGGSSYEEGNSIALDDAGNCYVTGYFSETAFFDPYTITSSGYYDIFVAQIDSSGNWLWVIQAGGTGLDEGYGITIDDLGNNYVTGVFEGTGTFGSYFIYSDGETDIFVAKIGSILSAENDILSFQIPEQIGETIINDVEYTVQLDVPSGTNITALIPTIEISAFATIYPESGIPQDFTEPVEYTVTAENGDEQIWTVTVSIIVSSEDDITMSVTKLIGNYPNPFNPSTLISFEIKEFEKGILSIYNIKGQLIVMNEFETGRHHYAWDARNHSSGIYLYKLQTENYTRIMKMLLVK